MGDNSAKNTGSVTRHEGDLELGSLAIRLSWLGPDMLVAKSHDLLEEHELHHSVRDLSAPERSDTLIEAVEALLSVDLGESGSEGGWELAWKGGLHSDLGGLERTQEDVSEHLGGGGGHGPDESLVVFVEVLSEDGRVEHLKKLIESILSDSLEVVANEGWSPSLVQSKPNEETGESGCEEQMGWSKSKRRKIGKSRKKYRKKTFLEVLATKALFWRRASPEGVEQGEGA